MLPKFKQINTAFIPLNMIAGKANLKHYSGNLWPKQPKAGVNFAG